MPHQNGDSHTYALDSHAFVPEVHGPGPSAPALGHDTAVAIHLASAPKETELSKFEKGILDGVRAIFHDSASDLEPPSGHEAEAHNICVPDDTSFDADMSLPDVNIC